MGLYANVPSYEEFVAAEQAGRVNASRRGDGYVVFKYSLQTTYARDWDNVTEHARGIIFDEQEGNRLVAFPYRKFWNAFELGGNDPRAELPSDGIRSAEILEKLDGSMGMIWLGRDGELNVSTPGSTCSDQASWATDHLRAMPEYDTLRRAFVAGLYRSVITEIIYPGSRMVLNYGDARKLVVTGVQVRDGLGDYRFMDHSELQMFGHTYGFEVVKIYTFADFAELRLMMKDMTDQEGFVLHWPYSGGFRLKLKCEWYLHLHRTISNIHPNRIEEAFRLHDLRASTDFEDFMHSANVCVMNFPEEFREPYDQALALLRSRYENEVALMEGYRALVVAHVDAFGYEAKSPAYISAAAREIGAGRIDVPRNYMGSVLSLIRGDFKMVTQGRVVGWWNDVRTQVDFDSIRSVEEE